MLSTLLSAGEPSAPAVAAPGRPALNHGGLRALVEQVGARLSALGIAQGDAVALVLPNGPEALTATIAVAARASVAPLNPALTEPEVRFFLGDLSARAVVVSEQAGPAVTAAARGAGVPVLVLKPAPGRPAGWFHLEPAAGQGRPPARGAGRDPSVALLLHTSGTTARPKLVGVRREALSLSALAIARNLSLGPADVCLNVMPLFHVHGLVGAALSSLAAGASVCCSDGFNSLRFRRLLAEAGATWYTAVPSMHQAIVARLRGAARNRDRRSLRFVRSCSSPLPGSVREALAECLGVPVVSAYGMTEAAHQVASTNPGGGFDGENDGHCSVGFSSGPEVRVIDPGGRCLPPGTPGEVVLRGPTVITAYEQPAEANETSFRDGWLRTGDQATIGSSGEIFLTGRLKELINASGEKISPYEVEDALLAHPGVAEAVCFGVPHAVRGETVAAAVVMTPGDGADERTLRRFLSERLAACKVPETILALPALPKGPTGKLQRIGMASRLGLGS